MSGLKKNNSIPVPKEEIEQQNLFRWAVWAEGKYPELSMMYHIPNGGSRNKREAAKLKAEGVKAGVPDICLPAARGKYHGLYIELKRERGGRVSDAQNDWLSALRAEGYAAIVCCGFEEAKEAVEAYLSMPKTQNQ